MIITSSREDLGVSVALVNTTTWTPKTTKEQKFKKEVIAAATANTDQPLLHDKYGAELTNLIHSSGLNIPLPATVDVVIDCLI